MKTSADTSSVAMTVPKKAAEKDRIFRPEMS